MGSGKFAQKLCDKWLEYVRARGRALTERESIEGERERKDETCEREEARG